MEVVTEILESNLVSAIIALIGVIISLKWYSCARRAILRARKKGTISIWRT